MAKLTSSQIQDLKENFKYYDYNKTGKITSRDIPVVVRGIGLKPAQHEVQHIQEEINARGGEVDMQSLVTLISQTVTPPEPDQPDDVIGILRMYDKEGRGLIPVDAMRHLMTTLGEKLTDDEVESLLRNTNCMENGQVAYERLVRTVMGR